MRWLDRCQGVRQPLASAFLVTPARADLAALAADLDALTSGLPAFCAQVRPGVVLLPSAAFKMLQTVEAATRWPSPTSSP